MDVAADVIELFSTKTLHKRTKCWPPQQAQQRRQEEEKRILIAMSSASLTRSSCAFLLYVIDGDAAPWCDRHHGDRRHWEQLVGKRGERPTLVYVMAKMYGRGRSVSQGRCRVCI